MAVVERSVGVSVVVGCSLLAGEEEKKNHPMRGGGCVLRG